MKAIKLEDLTIATCALCGHVKTDHYLNTFGEGRCESCPGLDFKWRHRFVMAHARPVICWPGSLNGKAEAVKGANEMTDWDELKRLVLITPGPDPHDPHNLLYHQIQEQVLTLIIKLQQEALASHTPSESAAQPKECQHCGEEYEEFHMCRDTQETIEHNDH